MKESFLQSLSSLFSSLVKFATIFALARGLSPDSYGVWVSVVSISALVMLGDLGVSNSLRNKLAELLIIKNTDSVQREYFFSVFYLLLCFSILLLVALYLVSSSLPIEDLFKTDNLNLREEGSEIFLFVQMCIIINIPFSIVPSLFFSYSEAKYVAFFNIATSVINLVTVLIFILVFHTSVLTLAKWYFVITVICNVAFTGFFIMKRKWLYKPEVSPVEMFLNVKRLMPLGMRFFGVQFSNAYILNIPTVFIASVVSVEIAGAYNLVQKLFTFSASVYQSAFNPIWSKITKLASENKWSEVGRMQFVVLAFSAALMLLLSVIISFFSIGYLDFVFGDGYTLPYWVIVFIGSSIFFYTLFESVAILQSAVGRLNIRLILQVASVFVLQFSITFFSEYFDYIAIPISATIVWFALFAGLYFESRMIINKR